METTKNKRLEISQDQQQLTIHFSWSEPGLLIAFPIGILLMIFASRSWSDFWFFKIYTIGVILVLTYLFLCFLFNKTYIIVSEQDIKIKHKPIPWWKGNVNVPAHEIKQIFVKEEKKHGKSGTYYRYHLYAQLFDSTTKKLLDSKIVGKEEVLQLEQLIEKYLGIENVPVEGEYNPIKLTISADEEVKEDEDKLLVKKMIAEENKKVYKDIFNSFTKFDLKTIVNGIKRVFKDFFKSFVKFIVKILPRIALISAIITFLLQQSQIKNIINYKKFELDYILVDSFYVRSGSTFAIGKLKKHNLAITKGVSYQDKKENKISIPIWVRIKDNKKIEAPHKVSTGGNKYIDIFKYNLNNIKGSFFAFFIFITWIYLILISPIKRRIQTVNNKE